MGHTVVEIAAFSSIIQNILCVLQEVSASSPPRLHTPRVQLPPYHHSWSDMAGHQMKKKKKINLFPLHLFKKLLICCLPMTGLAPTEEPIGRHHSCETLANPRLHSNVAHLYHGATSFPDAAYLWCLRGELEGAFRRTLKSVSGGARAGLQIWDYHRAQELKSESEVFVCCSAASDVEETLANTRVGKIANLALNCCWQPRDSGG